MEAKYIPTREDAYKLLTKYVQSDNHIKHALAVEGVMGHFSEIFNDPDKEKWRVIGLIHDLDYDMFPDQHCLKVREILEKENWPEEYIRAVVSHGWEICSDVEPISDLEKVLYTIDELTGLINATAIMRPSKSVMDLTVKSVKKKWKQKGFAAGVNREIIEKGAQKLGLDLDYVIEETIKGMQSVAAEIGLLGDL
ncbi:MAG: HD domain-containing protein [Clostridia bacterium]|nr:HD domain-containing protein [Clostridia bacterium]